MEKEDLIQNILKSNLTDKDKKEIIRLIQKNQFSEAITIFIRVCGVATSILHLFSSKET